MMAGLGIVSAEPGIEIAAAVEAAVVGIEVFAGIGTVVWVEVVAEMVETVVVVKPM